MDNVQEKTILTSLVKAWNINPVPEYRGFRCANCQSYINDAYYHWLNTDKFFLPVHFCEECNRLLLTGSIKPVNDNKSWLMPNILDASSERINEVLASIVATWEMSEPKNVPIIFYCDKCSKPLDIDPADNLRKGYHVWWAHEGKLHELHFHKPCWLKGIE